MDAVRLYNLTPTLAILATGAAVAGFPLFWVWRRQRAAAQADGWLRLLTWATLFLTFDLIVFGAFTRLTDSGLGCPDWPGCYGSASPLGAALHIEQAQAHMPTGPVTWSKAWIEMIHRYLATGVGGLIVLLTWLSWRQYRRADGKKTGASVLPHPAWATFTLVWVCLQGAFGALTVTMKLFPAVVTLHLLGGNVLLALLVAQAALLRPQAAGLSVGLTAGVTVGVVAAPGVVPQHAVVNSAPLQGRVWIATCAGAVLLQMALGGWVSTNYAVLACDTFPLCQGSLWPAMNFAQAFEWWRPLGHDSSGQLLQLAALTAIHYVHRLAAYVVLPLLAFVAWTLLRQPAWRSVGRGLGGLAVLQLATGLGNVLLGWPLLAAVLHTAGAAAMLALLVWVWFASRPISGLRGGFA